jgi:hypothetical protein
LASETTAARYHFSEADIAQTCCDARQNIMACDMGASLYEPINVYKPVAPDIGIVDGPFEYLTVGGAKLPLPFTTRMTVVRLSNGDLFLHSPIKFDWRLANGLLALGTVRHLVSPNQFHYAHGNGQKRFPMQSRGHRRVCAKGRVRATLISTLVGSRTFARLTSLENMPLIWAVLGGFEHELTSLDLG